MRVAYLVNTYPKPSHSFIRREVQAHERHGLDVVRFALRDERSALVDPGDILENDRTEHVLGLGPRRIARATAAQALAHPLTTLGALRLAVAGGRRSSRGTAHHLAYLAEACYLVRRFRELGVDHVHAHFGTNSAMVAMLVHALGGPTWSFTVHGPEEFDSPIALSLPEKISRATFTIAVSAFGRSQLCRWSDQAGWDRLHVVHCGVDPKDYVTHDPVPPRGPQGETHLINIGRLVEQKGQFLLVEAFARAVKAQPGLRLKLVGDGELRGPLERLIAAHGLRNHVMISGWVDEARVQRELAKAHALVMPSFAEGLPMVIMEAMAAGRPVAATLVAGVPELVQSGKTGWLFPAGDVESLSDVLVDIATSPTERLDAMGHAGRERALARHDVDREAAKLAALFRQATRAGKPRDARQDHPIQPEDLVAASPSG